MKCQCDRSYHLSFLSSSRNSAILDDLDDLFTAELASIDNMLESQQSKERESEERKRRESEELKKIEQKAMEVCVIKSI